MRRKILIAALILLPLIGLLAFAGRLENARKQGTPWRIAIEGYDPRDILRGHYLTYRYKWNWGITDAAEIAFPSCLCLKPGATGHDDPLVFPCSVETVCETLLKGGDLFSGKVYIPEEEAPLLETNLRGGMPMAVDVRALADGSIMVEGLVVEGKPLREYLKTIGDTP